LIEDGLTEQQIIDIYASLGIAETQARFIYAIETGQIDGDVIAEDDKGRQIPIRHEEIEESA
jgi:hypothetical protein